MQRVFVLISTISLLALGACTVHHHHPAKPNDQFTGAPGQHVEQENRAQAPAFQGDGYQAYGSDRYEEGNEYQYPRYQEPRAAQRSACDCSKCPQHGHNEHNTRSGVRGYQPAGPVTPDQLAPRNPADALE